MDPSRDTKTEPLSWLARLGVPLLLAAITFPVFSRSLFNDFVDLDDETYVVNNPAVQAGITARGLRWAFVTPRDGHWQPTVHGGNWHPLTWISLELDAQLFGPAARGFHLMNVLWHAAAVVLLYRVLLTMTGAVGKSALVAALFAVHPLRVESVAWVSERKDVLSAFFWILTMGAYARYTRRPDVLRYMLILVVYALGLMAKPMLVTLPFALLLLDYWPLQRIRRLSPGSAGDSVFMRDEYPTRFAEASMLSVLLEKVPLLLLAGGASLVTLYAQNEAGSVVDLHIFSRQERVANALTGYVWYLEKSFWPVNLGVFYSHTPGGTPLWQALASGAFLAILLGLALWQARKRPYLIVGVLWFLGTLVPVCGLVQVGEQAVADRYTYIPHIGLFIALVWEMGDLIGRLHVPTRLVTAGGATLIATLGIAAWIQTGTWHDTRTLWSHALAATTDNARPHANLGELDYREGHIREAIDHFTCFLKINDGYGVIHNELGACLLDRGNLAEAVSEFQTAVRMMPKLAAAQHNLGWALLRQGRPDQAVAPLEEAARLEPDEAGTQNALGLAYARQGAWSKAIASIRTACRLAPETFLYRCRLAHALSQSGQPEMAKSEYRLAFRIDSNWLASARTSAWRNATDPSEAGHDPALAVELATMAGEATNYVHAEDFDILAAAYAAAGRYPEAVGAARKALALYEASGRSDMVRQAKARLLLYQNRQPYRSPEKRAGGNA